MKKKLEKPFQGKLKNLLNDFINYKRNLGYKYESVRESLYRFSLFSMKYKISDYSLDKEIVLDWISKRRNESNGTYERRKNYLKQFALYMQYQGHSAYIPPKNQKTNRIEYIPYIFSEFEIKKLFNSIDSIKPHKRSIKDKVFPMLFRVLYCCGLRISEAINLKISDFDVNRGSLFIRESKFNKDRIIVVSDSLLHDLKKYHITQNINHSSESYFFRNKSGTHLTQKRVYDLYRKFLWEAGISHGGRGNGPRLHDFRHTFCVHTLAMLVKHGMDVYVALPILSKYIGHSSVSATQRYLRLTVDAYPELIKKVSKTCSYIFPEEFNK